MRSITRLLESIYPLALVLLLLFISMLFIEYETKELMLVIGVAFLISAPIVMPSLVLYFSYLSKGSRGEIYGDGTTIFYRKDKTYKVEKITLVQRNLHKNNDDVHSLLPWDSFYYAYIETNEGKSFYLTCLSHKRKVLFNLNGRVYFNIITSKWPNLDAHVREAKKKSDKPQVKKSNSVLDKEMW